MGREEVSDNVEDGGWMFGPSVVGKGGRSRGECREMADFVAGCITQAGEEGGEFAADTFVGVLFEDDGIES